MNCDLADYLLLQARLIDTVLNVVSITTRKLSTVVLDNCFDLARGLSDEFVHCIESVLYYKTCTSRYYAVTVDIPSGVSRNCNEVHVCVCVCVLLHVSARVLHDHGASV